MKIQFCILLTLLCFGRSYFPPNYDQRNEFESRFCNFVSSEEGLCAANWANTISETLSIYECIRSGNANTIISTQQLIDCVSPENSNSEELGKCQFFSDKQILLNAFKYVEEKGITLDSCYPRSSFLSGEEAKCSETCPSTNQTFPTTYKANFFSIENVESVKSHIVEEGPVIVLIEEFEDILHYKPKTTIKEKIKDKFIFDIDLGLRTFKIIGWITINNVEFWIAGNSWGRKWGIDGYLYLDLSNPYILGYYGAKMI